MLWFFIEKPKVRTILLEISIDLGTLPAAYLLQWNLALRKPDLRKNLDLRKIVGTTDFLVKIRTFWQF